MEVIITIILVTFGILQIILFFKLWGMTNNVADIKKLLSVRLKTSSSNVDTATTIEGWGWDKNITDLEKNKAIDLIDKLKFGQVIVYVYSKKKMEVWNSIFWENEKNNPDYKLIYKFMFSEGCLVQNIKTGKTLIVKQYNNELNKYICYSENGKMFEGSFYENELMIVD